MEFVEVLFLIMAVITGSALLILITKFLLFPSKSKGRRASENETEQWLKKKIRDLQEVYEEQIKSLKDTNKTLKGKANKYEGLYAKAKEGIIDDEDEDEIDISQYYVDKEAARPFIKNFGMNADALDSPVLQQLIMQKLKGNEELAITLGILKPRYGNQTPQTGPSGQSNFSDDFEKLVASGQVA